MKAGAPAGELGQSELRVQTFTEDRSGMRVGMPEVIVKVTHIPSGRSAYGCGERSQHANRAKAIALLTTEQATAPVNLAWLDDMTDAEIETLFAHFPQLKQRLIKALAK